MVSTKKPHILLDYASKEGKQHAMQEVLFRAYFTDGQNVSSDEVLKELAREVGLDVDKAMEALRDTEAVRDFEKGVKDAQTKGTYVFFFSVLLYVYTYHDVYAYDHHTLIQALLVFLSLRYH